MLTRRCIYYFTFLLDILISVRIVRFHDLRHTCATLLFAEGVHPKIVQETLGHASISMTIQKYKTTSAAVSRFADRQRHATTRVD
jgi:integrase